MKYIKYLIEFIRICLISVFFPILLGIGFLITLKIPHKFDLLFIYAIIIQIILVKIKYETLRETLVILIFHLIGLTMEIVEVRINGSWTYHADGTWLALFGIPLFTGFMYASMGSFASKAYDEMKMKIDNYPKNKYLYPYSLFVYLNFMTNNHIFDFRWILMATIILLIWKCKINFKLLDRIFWMPANIACGLTAFFILIVENIATYLRVWSYPNQIHGWKIVGFDKFTSWYLLFAVSFIVVYGVKNKI